MEKLFETESQSFGFFTSDEERDKFKEHISLTIEIEDEKVDLYDFQVMYVNDVLEFAVKHKEDENGNRIALYYWTKDTAGRLLDDFFNGCRKYGITPVDVVMKIREAMGERESLMNAKKLKEKENETT